MTWPQLEMIGQVRRLAEDDPRLSAVLMYGSFIKGEGDQYSDIEFYLFYERPLDHLEWVGGLRPVEMFFKNEHGTEVAVFDNLVRGEFHFLPAGEIGVVKSWEGLTSFEYAEEMILVDKAGALREALDGISRQRPRHDRPESVQWLAESLINDLIMTANLIRRGEAAHAQAAFQPLLKYLLWLMRLADGADNHWESPTKRLEAELSPGWYEIYTACVPTADLSTLTAAHNQAAGAARRLLTLLRAPAALSALLDRLPPLSPELGLADCQHTETP